LAKVIKGLRAEQQVLAGGGGGPSLKSLVQRRQAASDQRSALAQAHDGESEVYSKVLNQNSECRNGVFDQNQKARSADMQAQATNPEFQQKYIKLAQDMATAQAHGDTATVRKIQAEFMAPAAAGAHADTVAADKKCGKPPVKPRALVQQDSLLDLERTLDDQIRDLQQRGVQTAVQSSGLTDLQFAMARERIESYVSATKNHVTPRSFSQKELDALNAHASELQQLIST
jgi:hypothetical protein